jgi:hypothetical protein
MSQTQTIGTHKTAVYSDGEYQVVKYHYTPVVKFNRHEIVLDTGGWATVTTKLRMNQASNQYDLGYQVYQKNYDWFVDYKGETIKFKGEGIILTRND